MALSHKGVTTPTPSFSSTALSAKVFREALDNQYFKVLQLHKDDSFIKAWIQLCCSVHGEERSYAYSNSCKILLNNLPRHFELASPLKEQYSKINSKLIELGFATEEDIAYAFNSRFDWIDDVEDDEPPAVSPFITTPGNLSASSISSEQQRVATSQVSSLASSPLSTPSESPQLGSHSNPGGRNFSLSPFTNRASGANTSNRLSNALSATFIGASSLSGGSAASSTPSTPAPNKKSASPIGLIGSAPLHKLRPSPHESALASLANDFKPTSSITPSVGHTVNTEDGSHDTVPPLVLAGASKTSPNRVRVVADRSKFQDRTSTDQSDKTELPKLVSAASAERDRNNQSISDESDEDSDDNSDEEEEVDRERLHELFQCMCEVVRLGASFSLLPEHSSQFENCLMSAADIAKVLGYLTHMDEVASGLETEAQMLYVRVCRAADMLDYSDDLKQLMSELHGTVSTLRARSNLLTDTFDRFRSNVADLQAALSGIASADFMSDSDERKGDDQDRLAKMPPPCRVRNTTYLSVCQDARNLWCEQRVFWASIRDMLVDVGRNVLLCFREDNAPVSVCDPHPLLMGGEVLEAVQFPSIAAARQHLQFVLDSIEKVRCVAIEDGTEAYDHIRRMAARSFERLQPKIPTNSAQLDALLTDSDMHQYVPDLFPAFVVLSNSEAMREFALTLDIAVLERGAHAQLEEIAMSMPQCICNPETCVFQMEFDSSDHALTSGFRAMGFRTKKKMKTPRVQCEDCCTACVSSKFLAQLMIASTLSGKNCPFDQMQLQHIFCTTQSQLTNHAALFFPRGGHQAQSVSAETSGKQEAVVIIDAEEAAAAAAKKLKKKQKKKAKKEKERMLKQQRAVESSDSDSDSDDDVNNSDQNTPTQSKSVCASKPASAVLSPARSPLTPTISGSPSTSKQTNLQRHLDLCVLICSDAGARLQAAIDAVPSAFVGLAELSIKGSASSTPNTTPHNNGSSPMSSVEISVTISQPDVASLNLSSCASSAAALEMFEQRAQQRKELQTMGYAIKRAREGIVRAADREWKASFAAQEEMEKRVREFRVDIQRLSKILLSESVSDDSFAPPVQNTVAHAAAFNAPTLASDRELDTVGDTSASMSAWLRSLHADSFSHVERNTLANALVNCAERLPRNAGLWRLRRAAASLRVAIHRADDLFEDTGNGKIVKRLTTLLVTLDKRLQIKATEARALAEKSRKNATESAAATSPVKPTAPVQSTSPQPAVPPPSNAPVSTSSPVAAQKASAPSPTMQPIKITHVKLKSSLGASTSAPKSAAVPPSPALKAVKAIEPAAKQPATLTPTKTNLGPASLKLSPTPAVGSKTSPIAPVATLSASSSTSSLSSADSDYDSPSESEPISQGNDVASIQPVLAASQSEPAPIPAQAAPVPSQLPMLDMHAMQMLAAQLARAALGTTDPQQLQQPLAPVPPLGFPHGLPMNPNNLPGNMPGNLASMLANFPQLPPMSALSGHTGMPGMLPFGSALPGSMPPNAPFGFNPALLASMSTMQPMHGFAPLPDSNQTLNNSGMLPHIAGQNDQSMLAMQAAMMNQSAMAGLPNMMPPGFPSLQSAPAHMSQMPTLQPPGLPLPGDASMDALLHSYLSFGQSSAMPMMPPFGVNMPNMMPGAPPMNSMSMPNPAVYYPRADQHGWSQPESQHLFSSTQHESDQLAWVNDLTNINEGDAALDMSMFNAAVQATQFSGQPAAAPSGAQGLWPQAHPLQGVSLFSNAPPSNSLFANSKFSM